MPGLSERLLPLEAYSKTTHKTHLRNAGLGDMTGMGPTLPPQGMTRLDLVRPKKQNGPIPVLAGPQGRRTDCPAHPHDLQRRAGMKPL